MGGDSGPTRLGGAGDVAGGREVKVIDGTPEGFRRTQEYRVWCPPRPGPHHPATR